MADKNLKNNSEFNSEINLNMIKKYSEGDIYIRPMTYDDIDDIVRWRNSDGVRKFFIFRGDFTHDNQVNWYENHVCTGEVAQMIICEKTECDGAAGESQDTHKSQANHESKDTREKKLGCVYIRDIDHKNKKGEYGIFIGEDDVRGKGVGTKAAKLMLRYGFEELGLHRIYLRALEGNDRAVRSYEKAGFVKEGFLVDDAFVDGEYISVTWMAAINPNNY